MQLITSEYKQRHERKRQHLQAKSSSDFCRFLTHLFHPTLNSCNHIKVHNIKVHNRGIHPGANHISHNQEEIWALTSLSWDPCQQTTLPRSFMYPKTSPCTSRETMISNEVLRGNQSLDSEYPKNPHTQFRTSRTVVILGCWGFHCQTHTQKSNIPLHFRGGIVTEQSRSVGVFPYLPLSLFSWHLLRNHCTLLRYLLISINYITL